MLYANRILYVRRASGIGVWLGGAMKLGFATLLALGLLAGSAWASPWITFMTSWP